MRILISIFFGIGLIPIAPGTAGSAAAAVLGVLMFEIGGAALVAAAAAAATIAGFWAIYRISEDGDPPSVVIDEVAGQLLAMLPAAAILEFAVNDAGMSVAAFLWTVSFVLFRIFDIWKPGLIGRADRLPGALGIMLDDLCAGFAAAVIVAAGFALFLLSGP